VGAVEDQPVAPTDGAVDVSVKRYPVTPTLSVAVRVVTGTTRIVDVAGTWNAETTGAVVSGNMATVIENAARETVPVLLVALITMLTVVPTFVLLGVPVNEPVVASKVAQAGLLLMLKLVAFVAVGVKLYTLPAVTLVAGVLETIGIGCHGRPESAATVAL